jgi:hypothetical protein
MLTFLLDALWIQSLRSADHVGGDVRPHAQAVVALALVLTGGTHASAEPTRSLWTDFDDRARLFCSVTTGSAYLTLVDMNADGRDELLLSHSQLCQARYCSWFVYSPLSTAGHVLYVGQDFFELGRVRLAAETRRLCGCWNDGDDGKEQCTSLEFDELVAHEVTPCRLKDASVLDGGILQLRADEVCASAPRRAAWVETAGRRSREARVPDVASLEVEPYPDEQMVLSLVHNLETGAILGFNGLAKLRNLGAAATPAIPGLLCLIQEEVPNTPVAHGGDTGLRDAAETLTSIGPAIIPPIVQALDSPCGAPVGRKTDGRGCRLGLPLDQEDREYCDWVRSWLAGALGGLDPTVVPELIAAFRRSGPARPYLADVLGGFGNQGVAAIPLLVDALGDRDTILRARCATALGNIGPAAAAALPRLRTLAEDADHQLRAAAADAVARIERRHQ